MRCLTSQEERLACLSFLTWGGMARGWFCTHVPADRSCATCMRCARRDEQSCELWAWEKEGSAPVRQAGGIGCHSTCRGTKGGEMNGCTQVGERIGALIWCAEGSLASGRLQTVPSGGRRWDTIWGGWKACLKRRFNRGPLGRLVSHNVRAVALCA
jgi:hypothetical protein